MPTEIKRIQFIIACKKMKYIGIKLSYHVHDLYTKNYKKTMKQVTGDITKWRDI